MLTSGKLEKHPRKTQKSPKKSRKSLIKNVDNFC